MAWSQALSDEEWLVANLLGRLIKFILFFFEKSNIFFESELSKFR